MDYTWLLVVGSVERGLHLASLYHTYLTESARVTVVMRLSAPKPHMSPAETCMAGIAARVEIETLRPCNSLMSEPQLLYHSSRTLQEGNILYL